MSIQVPTAPHRSAAFAATVAFSLVCLLATPPKSDSQSAHAARTLAVHESIQAHLVSHHGTTVLNEQGHGSGTFSCPMVIDLKITYTQATVTFTCRTSRGSISGRGVTAYYAGGHTAHFSGAVSVKSGSGSYSRASGSVNINGTLTRGSYSLSATVNGSIRV